MAYNPAAITEFKDGSTPLTGTLALGSLFEAEFDQLYGNWNNFFSTNGLEFHIGIAEVKGANGVVHIADGTNADTNWISNAPLVVENDGNCYINIRTENTNDGGIIFSDPDAVYSGRLNYDHNIDSMGFYTSTSLRMSLNSTGLYIGGVGTPSNPLHVQSTTTPQMRVAYDADSYVTHTVTDGSYYVIALAETNNLSIQNVSQVQLYDGCVLTLMSSDEAEYLQLSHNGTNGVINTAGTSAGSITIPNTTNSSSSTTGAVIIGSGGNGGLGVAEDIYAGGQVVTTGAITAGTTLQVNSTTESTTKDTGSVITEGGIGAEKNIVNGGYLKSGKGRQVTGTKSGTDTSNNWYDAISDSLPNIGDKIIVSGSFGTSVVTNYKLNVYNYAERISSTVIRLYGEYMTENTSSGTTTIDFTDGSSTNVTLTLAW